LDKTKKTIETYDKHADSYQSKFMDFESYKTKLEAFCDILSPGAKVLDVGCGPGNAAKLLAESHKEFEILGIDLSTEMINRARTNVVSTRVNFSVGDIRNLNLKGTEYDAVLASFCLPHLTNEEAKKLVHDIGEALCEDGFLYLSCMEGSKSGFETTSFSSKDYIFFNYYSEEFIRDLLRKNKFEIIKLQRDKYPERDGSITIDMFFYAKKVG
jgi:2-polyprenyl-3-methyl-5-hydroxy-6-metoxy-1,4-benzoquinol methylase